MNKSPYDAVIVGAGFAGIYMLYRLKQQGLSAVVLEAGDGVGGTWFFNRYPGARCDFPSVEYSYSFSEELQQDYVWREKYAAQPEILEYINHVVDRFDLRGDIECGRRVERCQYLSEEQGWVISDDQGDRWQGRFCVMATGGLSVPFKPDIPGLDLFQGECYHTGEWPKSTVNFDNKRVAVIGTASSGVQVIPQAAKTARQVYAMHRSANYFAPAHNKPLENEDLNAVKARYNELRQGQRQTFLGTFDGGGAQSAFDLSDEERELYYQGYWQRGGSDIQGAFADLMVDEKANQTAAEFIKRQVRAMVEDPQAAEALTAIDFPLGSKRICLDWGFLESLNRENVTLVDVKADPIVEVNEQGISTKNHHYDVDVIVLATGFDAVTGALSKIDVVGSNGQTLKEAWSDGPVSYLGLGVAGFPNFFTVTGAGSPSVFSNVLVAIEQHVEWISDCIEWMQINGHRHIEAQASAQSDWVEHVRQVGDQTLITQGNSWYFGSNVPGKPRVFLPYLGGIAGYGQELSAIVEQGYAGFDVR